MPYFYLSSYIYDVRAQRAHALAASLDLVCAKFRISSEISTKFGSSGSEI